MSKQTLRWFIIVGVVGSTVVHLLIMYFAWYRTVDSIDKIQHFSGGIIVAAFVVYWALERYPHLLQGPWYVRLGVVVGLVTLVGVLWEFFEYAFDTVLSPLIAPYADPAQPSLHDTIRDLIADVGGAVLGALLFWRTADKASDT